MVFRVQVTGVCTVCRVKLSILLPALQSFNTPRCLLSAASLDHSYWAETLHYITLMQKCALNISRKMRFTRVCMVWFLKMDMCFLMNIPNGFFLNLFSVVVMFVSQYANVLGVGNSPSVPRSALSSSTENSLQLIAESVEYEFTQEIANDVENSNIVLSSAPLTGSQLSKHTLWLFIARLILIM